ncbi:MAG TPA: Gfo/Idh/MocA family oxidoreductase [Tepidisphaeraceae bacterium]|jgi:predicted dehydrogenase
MSLKSVLGLESSKKVRYGIVALGDISQESLMPGVSHTGNSVITALVTGNPEKARDVAKQYDVPPDHVYSYDDYAKLLSSGQVDAVYVATPNWRHAEFTLPALQAGVHVLLEKPMEVTADLCRRIIDVQKANPQSRLMVAYRLHFEPATLACIDVLRSGQIGRVRGFSSTFAQPLDPANHRATSGTAAGPLYDMGPYPINGVRNLFEAEPVEVFAVGTRHADSGLPMDFDHEVAVTMKFADGRVAQFVVSYVAASIDTFTVYGTEGTLRLDPAYGMGKAKTYELIVGGKPTTKTFKPTDHFGGELRYFSDCVLNGVDPEPDGEEGLLDVRIVEAAVESLKTGRPVKLPPYERNRRIDTKQAEKLRPVSAPEPVNAAKPTK